VHSGAILQYNSKSEVPLAQHIQRLL
jgi:hypothetical protein